MKFILISISITDLILCKLKVMILKNFLSLKSQSLYLSSKWTFLSLSQNLGLQLLMGLSRSPHTYFKIYYISKRACLYLAVPSPHCSWHPVIAWPLHSLCLHPHSQLESAWCNHRWQMEHPGNRPGSGLAGFYLDKKTVIPWQIIIIMAK